jgi:VanZ family protein
MGFIFYASSVSGSKIPSIFPSQDVLFHIVAYIALGFFFARALKNTFSILKRWHLVIFAALFGLAYGISDEFHQLFTPYRCVSGMDIFVDTLGSFIGGLLYKK